MIEPASNPQYKDANKIANVVLPGEPQYQPVMRGEAVAPDPVNAKPRKAPAAPAQHTPAWGGAPAPTPAAASNVPWAGQATPAPVPAASPAGPAWLNG